MSADNFYLLIQYSDFRNKIKHVKKTKEVPITQFFSLSTNEQIALLVQERDASQANELALAERVGELMDEIVKLNDEIARFKQEKIGKLYILMHHTFSISYSINLRCSINIRRHNGLHLN